MQQTIKTFLSNIENASLQLQQFSGEIEHKEEEIRYLLEQLHIFAEQLETSIPVNSFGEILKESTAMLKSRLHYWVSMIETHLEGKDFINQFEKSVVVTVFGNVNAGKSSLGNFIAGKHDELQAIYQSVPDFYIYDFSEGDLEKGAQKLPRNEFREGAIETTASIQYFTLKDGLTWVDTPGIHSINQQNEQLAKKYVDFADLILFLVPSSSPGKADEIEELSRLIEKRKSLLVAITKSDRVTKDEVDGRLIKVEAPKSDKDRLDQENYLANVLKEKEVYSKIKDAQFTSISINLAKKALTNHDTQGFIDSGLPRLYKQIGHVLSSDAILLKKQRPIAQINATIDELIYGFEDIEGITQMIQQLQDMQNRFKRQKAEVLNEKDRIIATLSSKAKLELDVELSLLQQRFSAGQDITSDDIRNIIEKVLLKHYQETVQKRLVNLISDVHVSQCNALEIAIEVQFKKQYSTVTQQHYEIDTVRRDPEGIFEKIGAFFGKEYTKPKVSSYTTSRQIVIGNNFSDVLLQSQKVLDEQVFQIVSQALVNIERDYFVENEYIIQNFITYLMKVKEELLQMKIVNEVMV